ncbi:surf-like protein [Ascosphaera acerosa]|nr:surf-like protein [Ascosphaera acerosa]
MKLSIGSASRIASSLQGHNAVGPPLPFLRPTAGRRCAQCLFQRHPQAQAQLPPYWQQRRGAVKQAADDPAWTSPIDNPPQLIRTGRKHGIGLYFLALVPITAFCLGTWQIQRLDWKTKLIAKFEDRLLKPPLPLPPVVDAAAVPDFDFRRVTATGRFRHDQEILVGPRMHEGKEGYLVVTPLERGAGQSTVLVSRGWIAREKKAQAARADGLPLGEVTVEGLLREPPKGNMFTPANFPDEGKWFFMDIAAMAAHTGAQPIFVEESFAPDLMALMDREARGIPIGRPPVVGLRNNHVQYIVTW